MGHLQHSCPDAMKVPQRRKKTIKQPKGWNFPCQPDEEEDDEEIDPPTNEEAQNTGEKVEKGSVNHEVSGTPAHTLRQEMIPVAMETGDSKCHHVSESSHSDKENPRVNEGTQLTFVTTTPS